MSEATTVEVLNVKRHAGIAGQYALSATVQYPGESPEVVTFVGSTYGGPIVMRTESGQEVFVSADALSRIGYELNEAWVRRFFA